jgi:hypothetical protein
MVPFIGSAMNHDGLENRRKCSVYRRIGHAPRGPGPPHWAWGSALPSAAVIEGAGGGLTGSALWSPPLGWRIGSTKLRTG